MFGFHTGMTVFPAESTCFGMRVFCSAAPIFSHGQHQGDKENPLGYRSWVVVMHDMYRSEIYELESSLTLTRLPRRWAGDRRNLGSRYLEAAKRVLLLWLRSERRPRIFTFLWTCFECLSGMAGLCGERKREVISAETINRSEPWQR